MNRRQDYLDSRISYLKRLPSVGPNWSGPGDCAAPKEVSCERAISFLKEMASACSIYKLEIPELVLGPRLDGDVVIEVDTPNRLFFCTFTEEYILVEFNGGVAHHIATFEEPSSAVRMIFETESQQIH